MSLDNIQLSPAVLAGLFNNKVVDLAEKQPEAILAKQSSAPFLGNNEKKVMVVIKNTGTAYLPEEELTLLLEILQACKMSMNDIALINSCHYPGAGYENLDKEIPYSIMLLFDVQTTELGIPLQVPLYQVQQHGNKKYLQSAALSVLQHNRDEKKKLWVSLKKVFEL